jgi:hypothetical protein
MNRRSKDIISIRKSVIQNRLRLMRVLRGTRRVDAQQLRLRAGIADFRKRLEERWRESGTGARVVDIKMYEKEKG